MNRKRIVPATLVGLAIIALAACNKEEPTPNTPNTGGNTGNGSTLNFTPSITQLDQFQKNILNDARQSFTVNIDNPSEIVGAKGTTVQFFAGSLVDAQGNTVTGNVDISLVEVLSEADMIMMNKPTVGENNGIRQPLITGGEILLDVTQNGQNLNLANGQQVMITIPTNDPDNNMQVFTGGPDSDTVIWQPQDTSSLAVLQTGYDFFCDSIRWINCDYFANFQGNKTDLLMTLPEGLDIFNTHNYLMITSMNSVVGYFNASPDDMPLLNNGYQIPVGFDTHFITVSVDENGNLYANVQSNTIEQDHEEIINDLVPMTEAQLKQAIESLN